VAAAACHGLAAAGQAHEHDASEGMEALEGGQPDRAMDAMQRALDKMRAEGGKKLGS
jgi:hypothetical protein